MVMKEKKPAHQRSAEKNGNPLISNAKFKQLYSMMLKCRMLDEKARILFPHPTSTANGLAAPGWEATAVGIAVDLRPADTIGLSHRNFITNFIKGVPLEAIFSDLHSRGTTPDNHHSSATDNGEVVSDTTSCSSNIAAQLKIAIAIALVNQRKKNGNITVAFAGKNSTSPTSWHEALDLAGAYDLPMIFVALENRSAQSTPIKGKSLGIKTHAYGFPCIPVDGNDVVAVYRVAQESIARARQGGGPTLIECKINQSGIDMAGQEQADPGKSCDPIIKMENYLVGKALFESHWKEQVVNKFEEELNLIVEFAKRVSRSAQN
jgi:TPP-dependent pyruvate/acetoin dehydrogenase alpha subunit